VTATWRPPARTAAAQAIYAAAEQDRAVNPERYVFDAERVVERACRLTGSGPESFSPGWRTALDVYLSSAAEEARLNAVGIRMALQTAAGRLAAGAQTSRCLADNPDVAARALTPPIVIVGGWRTGPTFLFRMLGTDPRLHAPLPSELVAPWLCTGGPKLELTAAQINCCTTSIPIWPTFIRQGRRCPKNVSWAWVPTCTTGASRRRPDCRLTRNSLPNRIFPKPTPVTETVSGCCPRRVRASVSS